MVEQGQQISDEVRALFVNQLKEWKGIGVHSLGRIFGSIDSNKLQNCDNFRAAAIKFGLDGSSIQDFQGTIDTSAFVESLLSPLSAQAQAMVDKVWRVLDPAELGNAGPGSDEIRLRFDSRKANTGTVYAGRYTDPNHAGSYRVITYLDEMQGDKRLARCEGIGGQGEPPSFILPSWVNPDGSIVIDFSAPPKGGPKDFVGNWDQDGIKFVKDGNKWPMVAKQRKDTVNQFLMNFDGEDEVVEADFMYLMKEIYASCKTDDKFIALLEESFGVCALPDQDPDFTNKINALVKQIGEALLTQAENVASDESVQQQLFARFDINGNGTLNIAEVETMIETLNVDFNRRCLDALMRRFDADHSKELSFAEFVRIIKN